MSETLEITGSTRATPIAGAAPVSEEKPKLVAAQACTICSKNLKHGDVVMLGKNRELQGITVHPRCVNDRSNIKSLEEMHIHLDPSREVSVAMRRVIQSRVKSLYKIIQKANAAKAQASGQG